MTIDEVEQYLIALKHCETCKSNDANDCKTCEYHQKGSSAKCYDAIDVGVNTIHKYKKITEILDDDTYYENYGNCAEGFIVSAIIEVIKDKDDRE